VNALTSLTAGDKRGQLIEIAGATILNDCYNSNPEALRSMIQTLAARPATRRILVAGEMLELGEHGPRSMPRAAAPPPKPASISSPASAETPNVLPPLHAPVASPRSFCRTQNPPADGWRRICALATRSSSKAPVAYTWSGPIEILKKSPQSG